MADAKHNTKVVTKLVEVTETVNDGVVLTLTDKEAAALLAITRLVGGEPVASSRRYTSAISSALERVGVSIKAYANPETRDSNYTILDRNLISGGLYFSDTIKEN